MKDLIERVKFIRLSEKLSQKEIADLLFIPFRTYQSWEVRDRNPSSAGIHLLKEFVRKYEEM